MASEQKGPIPDSYWVVAGRLIAGEYPGARDDERALSKLRRILDAGATFFLDLTREGEGNLRPYAPLFRDESLVAGRSIVHRRMPILDGWVPSAEEMRDILDTIDAAVREGHVVYMHCWGGIGRTGTVVGCYLVRHGMTPREALDEIARRRRETPDGHRRSPENDRQEQMVLGWLAGG